MTPSFWKGRRVFLTGHTGFKGSWMSLWLQSLGASVSGLALAPPTQTNLWEIARVATEMTASVHGDVQDADALALAMDAARPEIVMHMAAQSLVRASYQEPVRTYGTNVMGTVNLLEAVRQTPGVRAVLIITTDKCYENLEVQRGYRETDPMGGRDPYSNSKGCAELVTAAYRASFFNPPQNDQHGVSVASVRAGNVIGGGDWAADRLVPDLLSAFDRGAPVQIRHPHALRPWQHVLEPLRGYLMLAERLVLEGAKFAEGWNFGPEEDDAKPVEWIVQQMANRWGKGAVWKKDEREYPHEATLLRLDISKARHRLNWHPALRISDALDLTLAWNKAWRAGADMREVTLKQIASYQALAHPLTPVCA